MKHKIILYLLMAVFCSYFVVASAGYAPISVSGEIMIDGVPLAHADILLKGFIAGEEMFVSEQFLSNDNGLFFALLTVPEQSVVDLVVFIEFQDELYVESFFQVSAWQEVNGLFELTHEQAVVSFDTGSVGDAAAMVDDEESLINSIVADTEVSDDEIDLLEELNDGFVVSQQPVAKTPILEEPMVVSRNYFKWELFALMLLVLVVFIIRFEVSKK